MPTTLDAERTVQKSAVEPALDALLAAIGTTQDDASALRFVHADDAWYLEAEIYERTPSGGFSKTVEGLPVTRIERVRIDYGIPAHRAPCTDGDVCGEAVYCPPSRSLRKADVDPAIDAILQQAGLDQEDAVSVLLVGNRLEIDRIVRDDQGRIVQDPHARRASQVTERFDLGDHNPRPRGVVDAHVVANARDAVVRATGTDPAHATFVDIRTNHGSGDLELVIGLGTHCHDKWILKTETKENP